MHRHQHDEPQERVGQVITRREALSLFTAPLILGMAGHGFGKSAGEESPIKGSCVVRPQLTEGPYYLDVDLLRGDIRENRTGVGLLLSFSVSQIVSDACRPLEGAIVDVWHAAAGGEYSGVGQLQQERFLRGTQLVDARGNARFQTIYPGWYPGRTPHIHFKVRSSDDVSSAYEFTSQLFFDNGLSKQIYTSLNPYNDRGTMDTTNERDGIYRRGGSELLLDVQELDDGYAATFDIALYVS